MAETWTKKEREKKKRQNKQKKAEKRQERKDNTKDGNDMDSMIAYLDENGNLTSEKPDPRKKIKVIAEDIHIGAFNMNNMPQDNSARKGIITFFNSEKGYGFIKDKESGESIFVHVNAAYPEIKEQDKVMFEVEKGLKGLNAINVSLMK
jgi:cold shock CspA family protein